MGTVTAQAIVNRARVTLLDDDSLPGGGNSTWDRPSLPSELFDHLNAGLSAIALLRPSVFTLTLTHRMVPGIRQAIPDTTHALIDVRRNLGLNGTTPGRAITRVDMDHLDHADPDWPSSAASVLVEHWMRDEQETKAFYVYPPQPASPSTVELVVAGIPKMSSAADAIPIDDVYEQALYLFVLSHAYAKNAVRGDNAKSSGYYNQFLQMLGVRQQK